LEARLTIFRLQVMRYHRAGPGVSVPGRIVGQWRYNRCAKPFIRHRSEPRQRPTG
jgi:hypothetical protein